MYEAWFFMMTMMKFREMPLLLLPMSQKYGGNSGNFPNCNQIIQLPYPMREIDEISMMAKVFANTLAIYLAFLEIS